ncbi:hypothetical protein FRC04_003196 [Tulasnella sp. 424]|nr:hypothetical protein FRC04_003196 [Tulasnella sp. 424]
MPPHHNAVLRPRAPNIFPGSWAVGPQAPLETSAFGADTDALALGQTDSTGDRVLEKRRLRLAPEPLPRNAVLIAPSDSWRDAVRESVNLSVWTDPQLWQAGFIEFAISVIFTFITGAIGVTVSGYPIYMIGPALFVANTTVVALAIYAFSTATGAHINPLISIATMFAGLSHPALRGAFLRAGLGHARALEVHNGGCWIDPNGPVSVGQAAAIEFIAAFALLMVSFGVGLDPRQKQLYGATLGPLLVGLTVGLMTSATSALNPGYTGAGMFPARCLGLAVGLGKFYSHDWVWWVPDIAAAALHALLYCAVPPYTREVRCPEQRSNSQTATEVEIHAAKGGGVEGSGPQLHYKRPDAFQVHLINNLPPPELSDPPKLSEMSNTAESNMTYVRLGKSGLKISKLILGCMSYGSPEWEPWVLGESEGLEHIKTAYDLGINAFDTANVYSNGLSEVILGKAIKKYNLPRDEIVVMTKVWGTVGRTTSDALFLAAQNDLSKQRYTNQQGLSRKHIFDSVKHSLERLQLDYIDLLQCHRFDYNTPIEETMQALHDVVKAGYVRYIGMSSCYAWQFQKMQNYARKHGLTEFISMQNLHNAIYREEEREMAPMLQDSGVGMIPWSPLARGFLARPLKDETQRGKVDGWSAPLNGDPNQEVFLAEINASISEIAKKRGVSMAQVAVAWSLSKEFVTAPIVGTTSLEKLKDLVGGVHIKLTTEEINAIDKPYRPRSIVGFA